MIADYLSYEAIAIIMFAGMMLMLLTGQRVFGAIGFECNTNIRQI